MAQDPQRLLASVATATAGLFAGGALFGSCVQQPALLRSATTSGFRLAIFSVMYTRAAPLEATLATLSGAAALTTGLLEREVERLLFPRSNKRFHASKVWLVSGGVMVGIVPYTLVAMMTLNRQLLDADTALKQGDEWVQTSLKRRGRLHAGRTVASAVAFAGMVAALSGESNRRV